VRAFDLGFRVGPRINAAGRMDAARAVVELFEAADIEEARRLAARLDALNTERQRVQQEVTERAVAALEFGPHADDPVALSAGRGWHRGVIGLAASKLCERTGRPAIVITFDEDGTGHGSARSTEDFHMLDALTAASDLLEAFGGHAHAAGLLVREEKLPLLRERLNAHAAGVACLAAPEPCLHADLELAPERISLGLCEELRALEPFGQGWPEPVFVTRGLRVVSEPRVLKERHYKFNVNTEAGRVYEAVWWGGVEKSTATPRPGPRIELAYTVEANNWNGHTRLQLSVKDLKTANDES
jgi:single-stranded-DNA-specific exonuclease